MRSTLLLGLLLLALPAAADFEATQWRYRRVLTAAAPDTGVNGDLLLEAELLRRDGGNTADMRILNADGRECPYVKLRQQPVREQRLVDALLLNRGTADGRQQCELDLGTERRFHDTLRVQVHGTDYRLPVRVEGSSDRVRWQVLRDTAYVLAFAGEQPVLVDEVRYPRSDYRYLRLSVPAEPGSELRGAILALNEEKAGELRAWPHVSFAPRVTADARGRMTVLDWDFGASGAGVQTVECTVADSVFHRAVEVYAAAGDGRPWQRLGTGSIWRDRAGRENLQVDFPETRERLLQVRIHHADDAPLTMTAAQTLGTPWHLRWERRAGEQYQLWYGNPSARVPEYDFGLLQEAATTATVFTAGPEEQNPAWQAPARTVDEAVQQRPWALYAALGLGVLVMGGLALRLLRRPQL